MEELNQIKIHNFFSWMAKYCQHIDNIDNPLTDENNLEFFRRKIKEQFNFDICETMDIKKPPLGLKPRWIHDWERMVEITEAIERYVHAGKAIPKDWISELKELLLTNF